MFVSIISRRALLAAALSSLTLLSLSAQAAGPSLTPVDAVGLKKEVAKYRGKVVVLNFWATWCGPCKAEFPDLVSSTRVPGVQLLTVAVDDRADSKKASTFLEQNKVTSGALINKAGEEFDMGYIKWLEPKLPATAAISIPRTYVFSKSGKLVKVLIGGQSGDSFKKAIAEANAAK